MHRLTVLYICIFCAAGFAGIVPAYGDPNGKSDGDPLSFQLGDVQDNSIPVQDDADELTDPQFMESPPTESAQRPWSLGLTYSLYSDYIFRGINFSEYPREGREKRAGRAC